jgi:hypothetical protein
MSIPVNQETSFPLIFHSSPKKIYQYISSLLTETPQKFPPNQSDDLEEVRSIPKIESNVIAIDDLIVFTSGVPDLSSI